MKKAWSVKFNALAALLGGIEVLASYLQPDFIGNGLFGGLAAVVSVAAIYARVRAQKELAYVPKSSPENQ